MKLLEGGNVFKDKQGQPLTQRINQADVPATVKWLEQITGIKFPKDRWLGSTGRKPTSGDLDMAVDINDVSKEELANKLTQFIQGQDLDPREWIKKAGEVHLKTPIAGDPNKGYVQTDFMFFPNLDWGTFYYGGAEGSNYKGMNRNVLLSSIAKQQGLKVGANGMFSRTTNELVSGGQDPDYVAQVLLGQGATRENLKNVESIYSALANDPNKDTKLADFREYLSREGLEEPGQVNESEVSFLSRLRDRIVNQGMYALIESEQLNEDAMPKKDPRIPHPEDAFFKGGSTAAIHAIQSLTSAAANDRSITIKWDGKPALIFGRLPNGRLAVMDKYMFDAGYAAQSPEDWMRYDQQKKSGNLRTDLYPKLKAIWPGLDAATKGPGFFWGDLMWAGKLKPVNGEYHFKPNYVEYAIPVNSETGRVIGDKTGGIVVHQHYDNLGDKKATLWDGTGLQNVPGGVAILTPTLGTQFKLSKPNVSTALATVKKYGPAVDELLSSLPGSVRDRLQTYFNQRIIGGTTLSLHNWLRGNTSAKQFNELVVGNPNEQGQYNQATNNLPGKLFALDNTNKIVPSPAYNGLVKIWDSIYAVKLALAQQLEKQVQGLKQSSGGRTEGEGFVVDTPQGLVKLVNRGVFSAGNASQNNPA